MRQRRLGIRQSAKPIFLDVSCGWLARPRKEEETIELGLGTAWWGTLVRKNLLRRIDELITACQALDISYLDTAHSYANGLSELLVRLGTLRHSAWKPKIATKVGYGIPVDDVAGSPRTSRGTLIFSGSDKLTEKILRQSRHAARTLGPTNVDTLLLHNPPHWFTAQAQSWSRLNQQREKLGIRRIGFSSDNALELGDFPSNLPGVVIQISARQFVERNDFLCDVAEMTNIEVVVNSVMGLGPNIGDNLNLLATQKLRPTIVLYGTTRAGHLHAAAEHLHLLNGKI